MSGVTDKIGNLNWLGDPEFNDCGWVEVGEIETNEPPKTATSSELAWQHAKKLLAESDWAVLSDVPMTEPQKKSWLDYRRALRDIRLHPDFPNMVWPNKPE